MGSVLVMTLPNQVLSALGRLSLIFMLVIFGPENPQIIIARFLDRPPRSSAWPPPCC